MAAKRKALFICLGNICRSPITEGVFKKTVADLNLADQWEIDSAAIGGWHVGNPPDWRALDTMKKHGVPYDNTARQIVSEDFNHYDFIFGMDEANMKDLQKRAPKNSKAKLLLFGDYDPEGDRIIRDPYYRGVRQGDVISPKLFTAALEDAFKLLVWEGLGMASTLTDSDSVGFEKCYQQSVRCSKGFLEHLAKE